MERANMIAIASRIYDVKSQIEVARCAVQSLHELTDLVRDGMVVTLENLQEELTDIEESLTPPPVKMVAVRLDETNVYELRKAA